MQTQQPRAVAANQMASRFMFSGMNDGLRKIYQRNGVSGLFQGWAPAVQSQVSQRIIAMPVYGFFLNLFSGQSREQGGNTTPISSLVHFCAGGAAGGIAVLVCNPLEVVRTQMQTAKHSGTVSPGNVVRQILKQDGFKGLWAGSTLSLCRNALMIASELAVYERVKEDLSPYMNSVFGLNGQHAAMAQVVVASFLAGAVSTIVIHPLDFIKTRIQDQPGKTMFNVVKPAIEKDGCQVLYRGVLPHLWSRAGYTVLFFATYEACQARFNDRE
jgi:hypothetical protein